MKSMFFKKGKTVKFLKIDTSHKEKEFQKWQQETEQEIIKLSAVKEVKK